MASSSLRIRATVSLIGRVLLAGLVGAAAALSAADEPALLESALLESALLESAAAVERGRELFARVWEPQTPSRTQGDGLGPYFNERSCAACHKLGGLGGAGPSENNVQLIVTRFVDLQGVPDPELMRKQLYPFAANGVMVLHRRATIDAYDELRLQRLYFAAPDHPEVAALSRREKQQEVRFVCFCGSPPPVNPFEERNTPALFGAGLLDRVTLATLEVVAVDQAEEVRGRPAMLPDGTVGRFGWKGQNATLLDFCENASRG